VNNRNPHPGFQGVVYKKTNASFTVRCGEHVVECSLSPKLRQSSGDLTVGDNVRLLENANGTGIIVEVLPRQNKLSRQSAVPMPGAYAPEQVIVANVDQVIPVFSAANPAPRWRLLDRYLVTAEAHDLPALICITKLDIAPNGSIEAETRNTLEDYRRAGYPVMMVSAYTGAGLDQLKQALQGRTSVFLGKSGVGKTSLLNALQPGLGLRVNEISRATGKGKHTTTHLEMFPLDSGGAVVDTPGVREFGLWDIQLEDLAFFFPEMRPYLGHCKFGLDCRHDEEPGCAVRKAVTAGQISPRRYQSYMHIQEDA
jgi:ribosome biogenesis GTPase